MRIAPVLCLLTLTLATAHAQGPASTEAWRKAYANSLLAPEGWLKLAGLYWLKPGDNSIGSSQAADVRLPASAPPHLGTLDLINGHVHLTISAPNVLVDGKPATEADLHSDNESNTTHVQTGEITFKIIKRGSRTGVRIFDPHSGAMKQYRGLHWYPIRQDLHFKAKYTAYPTPKSLLITNVLGDTAPVPNPGYVTFTINSHTYRLEAQGGPDALFFNFHDLTSGDETYGAGRFLDAPGPKNGFVDLDFNRATNPPCGYTEFATCPLPPQANFLNVAIRAGEKKFHD
jgi:uncharacterized protein (DUF1684 family)